MPPRGATLGGRTVAPTGRGTHDVPLPSSYRPPVKKKKGGNAILNFINHSASVVKDSAEDAVDWSKKDLKATYKKGKAVYKAADKYGDARWEEIRHPRRADARQVAAGKAQARAAGQPYSLKYAPKGMLKLSPNAIASIIQEGAVTLNIPSKVAPAGERLGKVVGRLFEGTPKNVSGAGGKPGRFAQLMEPKTQYIQGDEGFAYRVPFLVNKNTGEVLHANLGDVHGNLYSTLAHRRLKARGIDGKVDRQDYWKEISKMRHEFNQGWVINPYEGKVRVELGHGADVGVMVPPNKRGLEQMLNWVTKDFDDVHIANRLSDEIAPRANHPGWPVGTSQEARIREEAFEAFLKEDKAFYHQGRRWRDEPVDAPKWYHQDPGLKPTPKGGREDYNDVVDTWRARKGMSPIKRPPKKPAPDEIDWTKIKSGEDYLDLVGWDAASKSKHQVGASGMQRLIKGMAEQTQDIARAKKWWGRKIGGAYPDEETLLQAYFDNQAQIAKELAKRRKR